MRIVVRVLAPLAVLAALVVVADRGGAWYAADAVADQVDAELAAQGVDSAPAEVTVDRVPFLTQVVTGEYESVTVVLRDLDSGPVRVSRAELVATDVRAELSQLVDGAGPVTAAQVRGTATVDYDSVAGLTGYDRLELAPDGDGVRVRLPTELVGIELVVVGAGQVTIDDGAVRLDVAEVQLADDAPAVPGVDAALATVAQQLSVTVDLPTLPYGLTVESVAVGEEGLVATVSARDVRLVS